jgi:hypothetical protein
MKGSSLIVYEMAPALDDGSGCALPVAEDGLTNILWRFRGRGYASGPGWVTNL